MAKNTLYNKVWDLHKVESLSGGQDQILIGLHLTHEVTSPQAYAMLRENKANVLFPNRTFATMDHIVPTNETERPYSDPKAEMMAQALERNVAEFGIKIFGKDSQKQGIVHVIGPELGLTQPGMTIACGDSHTSTHGAFGALAFGIGTTQVRYVLESQTLALKPFKVRRINFTGKLGKGVYAKDLILKVMALLGVNGGLGYAYEYAGPVIEALSMEERMTICNMSIEGGARIGYINPDQVTFDYLKGKEYAPKGEAFERACAFWQSIASGEDAEYDDEITIDCDAIEPMLTWGITPGQALGVSENLPDPESLGASEKQTALEAYQHMNFEANKPIKGTSIDVAFVGSCTNGRISDLREAATIMKGKKVAKHVKCLIVPGSMQVKVQAEKEGLDEIFKAAGAEWRDAGCSMCLAMNPDQLQGKQLSASSSNRNFIGRQGSKEGRTLLMSPAMVATAAVAGCVEDVRSFYD